MYVCMYVFLDLSLLIIVFCLLLTLTNAFTFYCFLLFLDSSISPLCILKIDSDLGIPIMK